MKRLFIMLLIACSAFTTISADPLAAPQKKPESVILTLNAIIQKFGQNEGQVYSVNRNPNTNIIESSIKIVPFHCSLNPIRNDNVLNAVAINFPKNEPLAYQFLHIQPGSNENFSLKVITNNGTSQGTQRIRTNKNQNMWLMCCKNPENPQLRDAYAIVWEDDGVDVDGTVYMITSLRPDIYSKNLETSKKTFKIVGRVDENIKDSLYNIYIAATGADLENIGDDEYIACVPVINKRFEWQTEIDERCVGRIRCIFPNGELCSAWINFDMVPGETYNITVHNGWYDEDRDYERRVGRWSGKSLLTDLQKRGVDDQTAVVADTIPVEYRNPDMRPDWRELLKPQYKKQIQLKLELVKMNIESIKANYQLIDEEIRGMRDHYRISTIYEKILKQNKEMDKKLQEVLKLAKEAGCPAKEMPTLYKEILEIYTFQNQAVNNFYKNFGYGTNAKPARKLQEYLTKQTEKYLKDLEKSLIE